MLPRETIYKCDKVVCFGRYTGSMSCFTCRNFARCSAIVTLVIAVIIGLFVTGVPTKLGFYRWLAHHNPDDRAAIGLAPSYMLPEEYRYSFEDVARADLNGQTAVVTGTDTGVGVIDPTSSLTLPGPY